MNQLDIEWTYSKRNRHKIILNDIQEFIDEHYEQALEILYGLKNPMYIYETIMVGVTELQGEAPLVSVAAKLAEALKDDYKDQVERIEMMARAIVLLAELDLYDIFYARNTYQIKPKLKLSDYVVKQLDELMYLPPMVSKPNPLQENTDSPYYSIDSDNILGGKINHHNGNIGLDVINTQNSIKWILDEDFLDNNIEDITHIEYKELYLKQSRETLKLLKNKSFYITNSVDKRGRIYTNGYYVNPQGDGFHKAMLNFANKEVVR